MKCTKLLLNYKKQLFIPQKQSKAPARIGTSLQEVQHRLEIADSPNGKSVQGETKSQNEMRLAPDHTKGQLLSEEQETGFLSHWPVVLPLSQSSSHVSY